MPAPRPLRFGAFFAPFHPVGQLGAPQASHEWATAHGRELSGRAGQAMMNAIQTHVEEQAADAALAAAEAPADETDVDDTEGAIA